MFGTAVQWFREAVVLWCRAVVVITTAQINSTKTKLRFCAGSNPARGDLRW